jgi:hypothetical protein
MLDGEIPIGRKLFEEIDKPIESKLTSENRDEGIIEIESSWTGDIKGYKPFPSGRAVGSGHSYIHNNGGIIISHWQGEFRTEGNEEEEYMTFKGRDVNKNGKFVVLRTYFTKSDTLESMNGLVCILSGKVETSPRVFKSTGYELIL